MLEVLSQTPEDQTQSFAEIFKASTYSGVFDEFAAEASQVAAGLASKASSTNDNGTRKSSFLLWLYQFQILFRRSTYITIKDRHVSCSHTIQDTL